MTLAKALSSRVNELLQQHNMSQYRLSILSGVPQSTIGDILHMRNKTVNVNTIYDIAQAFNMDLPAFFNSPIFSYENITD